MTAKDIKESIKLLENLLDVCDQRRKEIMNELIVQCDLWAKACKEEGIEVD